MAETQKETQAASATMEASEFSSLLNKNFKPQTDGAKKEIESAVRTLAQQALASSKLISSDVVETINAMIAEIDRKMSEQINQILHHEEFQKLEGAWRGLHYLVSNSETDDQLKIRVMNISKKDLHKTLKRYKGAAWDQSPIFKKLYEEEYGTLGGEPFACLVGDYYFDHGPMDVELLGEMAKIAAAAHAPVPLRRFPDRLRDGVVAGAGEPARPHQDLLGARVRRLAIPARVRRRPLPRSVHAALPGASSLRRQDQSRRGVQLRGRCRDARLQELHLGQRGLRHGREHQPFLQALRLVLAHPRHRIRRRGRRPAHAHLPDRRRRRGSQVPHRDRHQRPARGRAGQERLHAAHLQEELGLRRLHRRPVPAEAGDRTTIRMPRPTRPWQPACRTSSPPAASRTT